MAHATKEEAAKNTKLIMEGDVKTAPDAHKKTVKKTMNHLGKKHLAVSLWGFIVADAFKLQADV